jgi:hypothetical protein
LENPNLSEVFGVDWRIILKLDFREVRLEGVGWIDLAQDRDRLQTLVNMVMNFSVP